MKTTRNKYTEVNQRFSLKDQNYLRKFDNAAADPAIQMFTRTTNLFLCFLQIQVRPFTTRN